MCYTRSTSAQKFVNQALTKLLVYYHDGNVRTWYGRHHLPAGREAADPRAVELKRHDRYVVSVAASIKVALLYDLVTGQEIRRFKKGEWV